MIAQLLLVVGVALPVSKGTALREEWEQLMGSPGQALGEAWSLFSHKHVPRTHS